MPLWFKNITPYPPTQRLPGFGLSVKLLLGPARTVNSGLSFLEIHNQKFVLSLTRMCSEMGPPIRRERCGSFCVGATFVAP
jgi:hypothetical protein